jgi:hypothetical protein
MGQSKVHSVALYKTKVAGWAKNAAFFVFFWLQGQLECTAGWVARLQVI